MPDVLPVRAVVVDFDGTACMHDAAEHILDAFADPSWRRYDEAWERGEIGAAEGLALQAAMSTATTAEMIAFALGHCPMDPTFAPFVRRCQDAGVPVTIASDGFGFYIPPLLAAVGAKPSAIRTNTWTDARMTFPDAHPDCMNCGTCKMNVVLGEPGPVAFVGEGASDRFAANYADVVFAKDVLVTLCDGDGVAWRPWGDFDDVWAGLTDGTPLPGPVAPVSCPGWMPRPTPLSPPA